MTPTRSSRQKAALALVIVLFLQYPLLAFFVSEETILGVPLVICYLLVVWLIIAFVAYLFSYNTSKQVERDD